VENLGDYGDFVVFLGISEFWEQIMFLGKNFM
jgi:hypothetical protein